MKKEIKTAVVLIMFSVISFAIIPGQLFAQNKPIEISVNVFLPERAWVSQAVFNPWAREIEALCNNKVKINIFYGATLSSPKDAYDSAVNGIADIAFGIHGDNPGRFPMMSIYSILPIGQSMMASQHVLYDLYQKFPQIEAEHKGVKVLYVSGIRELTYFMKTPVRKLEDMKGLKLRSPGIGGEMFKEFGAASISVPGIEIYSALQKNIIDGAGTDWAVAFAFKLHEVTNYALMAPFPSASNFLVMNQKKWGSLPHDVQQVFNFQSAKYMLESGAPSDALSYNIMRKYKSMPGKEVVIIPPEERERFYKAGRPMHEKWIASMESKGLPGQELFDEAVKLSKKYDAMYPPPWLNK